MRPILLVFTLLFSMQVSAMVQSISSSIASSAAVNDSYSCANFPSTEISNAFAYRLLKGYVILSVDYKAGPFLTSGSVSVLVDIALYADENTLLDHHSETLMVNYNNNYLETEIDRSSYAFEGATKVVVTLLEINQATSGNLPANVKLTSTIISDIVYDFSSLANTVPNDCEMDVSFVEAVAGELVLTDGGIGFVNIVWPKNDVGSPNDEETESLIAQREEIELEWTFVNDYTETTTSVDPSHLNYNFWNNSTRIRTTEHSYVIPATFEKGYVLFRFRVVGRSLSNMDVPVYGKWSSDESGTVQDFIDDGHKHIHMSNSHFALLNWQVTTTYAEDGKRKDVASYFDGALRNRQTVTRMTSTDVAVVGESVYDYNNRPVIQVLPTPVIDEESHGEIRFYRNFNQGSINGSTSNYLAKHFDIDTPNDPCAVDTPPMNDNSGASKYYSENNEGLVSETDLIPNANGYPFSQTEYMPDNTGRVRRQGGVGPEFQLGSGHETFNFYATPDQINLDRLFGSQAGDASHYKKNMVVDPNGQASVSYLDLSDKVVATALVGANPVNLLPISVDHPVVGDQITPESSVVGTTHSDMFNENANGVSVTNHINIDANSIEFVRSLLVPIEQDYTFDYSLEIANDPDTCHPDICMHCVYDFSMTITNECGVVIWENDPTVDLIGHVVEGANGSGLQFSTDCSEEMAQTSTAFSFVVASMPRGVYTIVKKLHVNDDAVNFYVQQMLSDTTSACVHTLAEFYEEASQNVDADNCATEFDCQACFAQLGDRDYYIATGPLSNAENALAYDYHYEQCRKMCDPLSPCKSSYLMMLSDVSKGGQYGKYEWNDGTSVSVDPGQYPLSVFNVANHLSTNSPEPNASWKNPSLLLNDFSYPYFISEDGTRSKILLAHNADGTYTPAVESPSSVFNINGSFYTYPEHLSNVQDFLDYWEFSWAASLVQYHPEWCYYVSCSDYNKYQTPADYLTSDQFDELMNNSTTFADAVQNGLVVSTGSTSSNPYNLGAWAGGPSAGTYTYTLGTGGAPYDPFIHYGMTAGQVFTDATPREYGHELSNTFSNYNNTGLSLEGVATRIVICQHFPSGAMCTSSATDFAGYFGTSLGAGAMEVQLQNEMWAQVKSLYLSAKSSLQWQRDNWYTRHVCPGCNECFEHTTYSATLQNALNAANPDIAEQQPCYGANWYLYSHMTPRFVNANQIIAHAQSSNAGPYYSQCANEMHLQALLNALASDQNLDNQAVDLTDGYSEFEPVFEACNFNFPAANSGVLWYGSVLGSELTVVWHPADVSNYCYLHLTKPTGLVGFDDIIDFSNLQGGAGNDFTALCTFYNAANQIISANISGDISCLPLDTDCVVELPSTTCKPTNLADDVEPLLNLLLATEHFRDSTFNLVNFQTSPNLYWNLILAQFDCGCHLSDLEWRWTDTTCGIYCNGMGGIVFTYELGEGLGNIDLQKITGIECRQNTGLGGVLPYMSYKLDSDSTFSALLSANVVFCNCPEQVNPCCVGEGFEEAEAMEAAIAYVVQKISLTSAGAYPVLQNATVGFTSHEVLAMHLGNMTAGQAFFTHDTTEFQGQFIEKMLFDLGSCVVTIELLGDTNNATWVLPNLVAIANFKIVGETDLNGFYHDFTFNAASSDGTVYCLRGTSCIPMRICDLVPPCPTVPEIPVIEVEIGDPCEDMVFSEAMQNAYSQFLTWQTQYSTQIASEYRNHCLQAVDENLYGTYNENEYHYTLYYYDQAGNLVRTVPPSGVNLLKIYSDTDPIEQRIIEDRTNGTQRISTFHSLATTYTYNSLNQLVKQSIPDHDKMDIWDVSLPNGLHEDFINNEMQFTSAAMGHAAGEVPYTTTNSRGYLYNTVDGGHNWSRMDGLVASNLSKVKMITYNIGYAVGSTGVLLKTVDGGLTWDLVPTYENFYTAPGASSNLLPTNFTDLAFNVGSVNPNLANVIGLIVGEDGVIFKISGITATGQTVERLTCVVNGLTPSMPAYGTGWDFTSVEFDAQGAFVLLAQMTNASLGITFSMPLELFINTLSSTPTLEVQHKIQAPDHRSFCTFQNGSLKSAYLGDVDGRLFYCPNINTTNQEYFQIATDHNLIFKKLWFYDRNAGLGLLSNGTTSVLYSTKDAGHTWQELAPSGTLINDLYSYMSDPDCGPYNSFLGARLIGVGQNGVVARISVVKQGDNYAFGYSALNAPYTHPEFTSVWATVTKPCQNGQYAVRIIAGGVDGALWTCMFNGNAAMAVWQNISSQDLPTTIKEMEFANAPITSSASSVVDSYPVISGVILTTDGKLNTFFYDGVNPDCSSSTSCDYMTNTGNTSFCPLNCPTDYAYQPVSSTVTDNLFFTHLVKDQIYTTPYPKIWAFSETPGTSGVTLDLVTFTLADNVAPVPSDAEVAWGDNDPIPTINELAYADNGTNGSDFAYVLCANGQLRWMKLSSTVLSFQTHHGQKMRPLPLNQVKYPHFDSAINNGLRLHAVGKSGTLMMRAIGLSADNWFITSTGTTKDFTAIDMANATNGVAVSRQGSLHRIAVTNGDVNTTPTASLYQVSYTSPQPLRAVLCANTSGINDIYAAGDNGTLIFASNILATQFYSIGEAGGALTGLTYVPSTTSTISGVAMAVGSNSRMYRMMGSAKVLVKDLFITPISDVNFVNAAEGYVVANNFTLRHTTDGGLHWNIVLPENADHMSIIRNLKLNKVLNDHSGHAVVIGNQNNAPVICQVYNNVLFSNEGITGSVSGQRYVLNDIQQDDQGNYYIVGARKQITSPTQADSSIPSSSHYGLMVTRLANGTTWDEQAARPGTEFKAFHIFPSNNTILACGKYGVIDQWNNDGLSWTNTDSFTPLASDIVGGSSWLNVCSFNDIYFHDDVVGYVVGDKGVILKTGIPGTPTYNPTTGLLNPFVGCSWTQKNTGPSLLGQDDPSGMQINTLVFPTRWEGLWGGSYIGNAQGVTRNVLDESEMFSTKFWYDRLGRIVLSQNTKQFNGTTKKFSYTLFDALGRVKEAGEKAENPNASQTQFAEIFGNTVEGYYNAKTINDARLLAFISGSGSRYEVTTTFYDRSVLSANLPSGFAQDNLRKRVASVTYEKIYNGLNGQYDHATHYSYDIHGNVKTLIQDYPFMNTIDPGAGFGQRRLDYKYDLISGNVIQVSYQAGSPDQFYHRYDYDQDNRITSVHTTNFGWDGTNGAGNLNMPLDMPFWEKDASYRYYYHGPLARVEIGDIAVQGVDYAYSLQGWIKGVNSTALDASADMGRDGLFEALSSSSSEVCANSNPNGVFARDAFSYGLHYFEGDYSSIRPTMWQAQTESSSLMMARSDLWNGNISAMTTTLWSPALNDPFPNMALPQAMAYNYDQLNRLINASAYSGLSNEGMSSTSQYAWPNQGFVTSNSYRNEFTYDENGNILTQNRFNKVEGQFDMQTYRYNYTPEGMLAQNRLYHVNDKPGPEEDYYDVDDQGAWLDGQPLGDQTLNYAYDELGQLMSDAAEEIEQINWRVDGKIKSVIRTQGSTRKSMAFEYDAMGNRIAKIVFDGQSIYEAYELDYTFYIRDAQGNVMSTYTLKINEDEALFLCSEQPIYGSSRLGMRKPNIKMIGAHIQDFALTFSFTRGIKQYELSNHLGNVLSTVSDRKIAVESYDCDDWDHYMPDILSYSDYYPFGAPMQTNKAEQDRTWDQSDYFTSIGAPEREGYRYGFNGKELDRVGMGGGQATYDYGFRIYNPAIGKFLSVDPLTFKYPELTPYQYASNTPIQAIDIDGLEAFFIHGTNSGPDRWLWDPNNNDTPKECTKNLMKMTNNTTNNAQFRWGSHYWGNGLCNSKLDRNGAAMQLVEHIMKYANGNEDITLIGHSHGGNVAIQAIPYLKEAMNADPRFKDVKINLITLNTPVDNQKDSRENPETYGDLISQHIHLFNTDDVIQKTGANIFGNSPLSGNSGMLGESFDRTFNNKGTWNVELKVSLYCTKWFLCSGPYVDGVDAHSVDHNHPDVIKQGIANGIIPVLQKK